MATAPRFWRENPSRYNLVGFKCHSCGRTYFPPRAICPVCHRKSVGKLEKVKLKGEGKVFSFTEVQEGLEELTLQKPYILALVEMDEGARVTGQVIDCETCNLEIGTRVRATLRKLSEEGPSGIIHYGYKFVPVREKSP
ncbi:MAG: Zn-ribbon domain-containing OB-fold protein [Thermoplasmata archaeon]